MSIKLNEVQQRLSEIDATKFHKMVDVYLSKKYNYQIHSTGTKTGEDKPRKGTPDTLITLDNGNYIFVEYTAQKTNIKNKFLDDIEKCLDSKKTGIEKHKIEKIILACNYSLQSNDIEELRNGCQGIVCDVITNSTLSYNLVNHYPTVAKDFLGIDIGNILTPNFLKEKYKQNFKTISLLLNNTPKPIDEIFVNLAIIKEKKEEQTKEYKREALLSSYEEIHKPKEPIKIEELINTSKKSLIYGKAGVGKTTLCKYIAYKWANEKLYSEFEYVIYISLREWKSKGLKGAIKDTYYSQDDKDITLDIKENTQKILFLFDGYDELVEEKKRDLQKEIEVHGLTHYIITSRPYGYQKNDFRVDEHFETIGFTDEDVAKYIENFFDNEAEQKALKEFLQSNIGIKHIAYIPLMLEMICSLWVKESFSDSLTMTELYSQVVENILQKQNKHNKQVSKPINREKIQKNLGKIALEGLKEQQIVFDFKFINQIFSEDEMNFFENNAIPSGFIKSDRSEEDILDTKLEFPHLTFQEYFSALYVASLSPKEQSEIIRDWKFYPHMQMFFAFLGGLIEDKEFLLGEIESEPRDLVGVYELFLLSYCQSEMPSIDNQIHMQKIIQWLEYSIKDEKLYTNLFLPLLKRIEVNKFFHTKEINYALYDFIKKYSKQKHVTHNLIVTIVDKLAYILPIIIENEIDICEKYSKLVKNEAISVYVKSAMARGFSTLTNTDSIAKILIKIINEKKNLDFMAWMSKALIEINPNNIDHIDTVIDFLKQNNNYENLDEETFHLLCKSFTKTKKKQILIDKLETLLDDSMLQNNNHIVLRSTIKNLKSSIHISKNKHIKNRFETYHLSKADVYQLIHNTNILGEYTEEMYINNLISIVENSKFDNYSDRRYALITLESLDRSDDKILNLAINYLKSEISDLKGEATNLFFSINRDDDEYLNILENAIKNFNDHGDKYIIWQKLFFMKRKDKKYINILMKYLGSVSPEIIKKSILIKDFSLFQKVYSQIHHSQLSTFLSTEIDINILFQVYDTSLDIQNSIISNIVYSKKPLYLKNNKLHTIENGKEISTKREIDEKTLSEIQTFISSIRTHP